jgi:hypothetical protein
MPENIGNAVLVIACLYFIYAYGFSWWLVLLMLWSIANWLTVGFHDERKEWFKSLIELNKAKAEYYRKKSRWMA